MEYVNSFVEQVQAASPVVGGLAVLGSIVAISLGLKVRADKK
jgi:hypothetical protein